MKLKNHTYIDEQDNFLIVAPTYKILVQSTLPPYLNIMRGCGTFNKADMTFKINGGGTVYMRSGTDPDSIVGITNVRAVWGDEAGLFSLYFSENIAARAAFRGAQVLYTTSPYALNWLYKDIIRPKMKNASSRSDVTLIQAASWENPYFPKDVIERNRATMDDRRFRALFGGEWTRAAGLVYDCFNEDENQCESFSMPAGTRFFGGVDWGYTDPFVLKIRAITPSGNHYGVSEFYKSGLTISDIVSVIKQKNAIFKMAAVYCDPSQPAHIEELCRNGIPAMAADNNIRLGIDRHYELMKTRRLKYFKGLNPNTIDEIETYHYPAPDELGPDDDTKEQLPVDQHNHANDAERYITMMTWNSANRLSPVVPDTGDKEKNMAVQDRDDLLKKRRPGVNMQTEKWGI